MLKQRTPLKKTPFKVKATWKKLQPISKAKHRRQKRFVPPATLLELDQRSGGRCECYIWVVDNIPAMKDGEFFLAHSDKMVRCTRWAERQPHHLKKRSRGGKHTKENCLKVCWEHHAYIENHDKISVQRGLSII